MKEDHCHDSAEFFLPVAKRGGGRRVSQVVRYVSPGVRRASAWVIRPRLVSTRWSLLSSRSQVLPMCRNKELQEIKKDYRKFKMSAEKKKIASNMKINEHNISSKEIEDLSFETDRLESNAHSLSNHIDRRDRVNS